MSDQSSRSSVQPPTGVAAFAGYRNGVDDLAGQADRRIGRLDLGLAIGGNLAAIGFCFAPWLGYETPLLDTTRMESASETGFATDGWILLAAGIVAVIAFTVATMQGDQALAVATGFAMSVVAFLAAGTTWMLIGMAAPEHAEAVHAEWGVMAATGAAIIACIFTFRAMQRARI